MKKTVYQIGDKVRILRPNWIERVGYQLIWTDLVDEVENDPRTTEALAALGYPKLSKKAKRGLLKAIAMARVEERNFGGRERKIIHEKPSDISSIWDYAGFGMAIISKRVAKTGIYCSGYHGYDEWYPACLADEKTHVILKLDRGEISSADVELW